MNKIQQAMRNKVNEALGEVEYQLDLFMDNNYKSNFKIEKYLKQLEFKRKLVEMMKPEWDTLIAEVSSEEPDFVENSYPKYIRRSANITVLLSPAFLYTKSMSEDICLLSKVLLTKSKDMPCGSNS